MSTLMTVNYLKSGYHVHWFFFRKFIICSNISGYCGCYEGVFCVITIIFIYSFSFIRRCQTWSGWFHFLQCAGWKSISFQKLEYNHSLFLCNSNCKSILFEFFLTVHVRIQKYSKTVRRRVCITNFTLLLTCSFFL